MQIGGARRRFALLLLLFLAATLFHVVLGRNHVTPFLYPDELVYEKLAQAFADGHPFSIRGAPYFFPAFLVPLVQAPAWLVGSVPDGIEAQRILQAAVMSSAAFPLYRLARQLSLTHGDAMLAAAAGVTAPWLAYHAFLLSEPVAYPLFFLALSAVLNAFERPTRRRTALVGAAILAVLLTRVQFVAVPAAYVTAVVAVPLLRREPLRPAIRGHLGVIASLCAVGAVATAFRSELLGPYYTDLPTPSITYSPLDAATWSLRTLSLLPWGAGWLILPGTIAGLAWLLRRSPSRSDTAFATFTMTFALLTFIQIGVVRAADWHHSTVERYAIYLLPLLVLSFLVHARHEAPLPRLVAASGAVLAVLAWLIPFPTALPFTYVADSPTSTSFAFAGQWLEAHAGFIAANFAEVAAVAVTVGLTVVVAAAIRGRGGRFALGASIAFLLVSTIAFYRMDAGVTRGVQRAWLASPADWLDQRGVQNVRYLELPGAVSQFGRESETWNRAVTRVAYLRTPRAANDRYPSERARIAQNGTLLVEGRPIPAQLLVVNDYGARIELEGVTIAEGRPGLRLVRVPGAARVASLAIGLYVDGWSARELRFETWDDGGRSRRAGRYRVILKLPQGHAARTVTMSVQGGARTTVKLVPGRSVVAELAAAGDPLPPLRLVSSKVDLADPRRIPHQVGVIIGELRFLPRP